MVYRPHFLWNTKFVTSPTDSKMCNVF